MNTNAFQIACRKEFAFLTESYSFKEAPPVPKESPNQIVFEKQGWKIVVVDMSHGTSASIHIYSPRGEVGLFHHLIEPDFELHERPKFEMGLFGEIGFQACCLQTFGTAFLGGDWRDFEVLQQRQRELLVKKGILKCLSL
jgi:hypothetical protein